MIVMVTWQRFLMRRNEKEEWTMSVGLPDLSLAVSRGKEEQKAIDDEEDEERSKLISSKEKEAAENWWKQ